MSRPRPTSQGVLLLLAAALHACGGETPAPAGDSAGTPPPSSAEPGGAPAESPAPPAGTTWSVQVGGSGISLSLADDDGDPLLRVACTRDPAVMTVEGETFTPIGSEERLSFGVDDEPFVFVADPTADRPSGVEAEAPIQEELLQRFERAREVRAVYGAQTLGPFPAPDSVDVERFVRACRELAGRAPSGR